MIFLPPAALKWTKFRDVDITLVVDKDLSSILRHASDWAGGCRKSKSIYLESFLILQIIYCYKLFIVECELPISIILFFSILMNSISNLV